MIFVKVTFVFVLKSIHIHFQQSFNLTIYICSSSQSGWKCGGIKEIFNFFPFSLLSVYKRIVRTIGVFVFTIFCCVTTCTNNLMQLPLSILDSNVLVFLHAPSLRSISRCSAALHHLLVDWLNEAYGAYIDSVPHVSRGSFHR